VWFPQKNEKRWLNVSSTPEFLPGEANPYRVYTVLQDVTEQKSLAHSLQERRKELQVLYFISEIANQNELSISEFLHEVTLRIPGAWQYPQSTCARIVINEDEFKTKPFKITPWKQSAPIQIEEQKAGFVEVYYLEKKPAEYEGPFLKEERDLINAIAGLLGRNVSRRQGQERLQKLTAGLSDAQSLSQIGSYEVDHLTQKITWTDELYRIFNLKPGEITLTLHTINQFIHPEDRERQFRTFTQSVSSQLPLDSEYRILLADGTIKYTHTVGKTIYDQNGNPIKTIGTVARYYRTQITGTEP
jgi:PAS domain-containing protein